MSAKARPPGRPICELSATADQPDRDLGLRRQNRGDRRIMRRRRRLKAFGKSLAAARIGRSSPNHETNDPGATRAASARPSAPPCGQSPPRRGLAPESKPARPAARRRKPAGKVRARQIAEVAAIVSFEAAKTSASAAASTLPSRPIRSRISLLSFGGENGHECA